MKTYTHNILAVFFGLYFLVVGTGFNVVDYCCNSCEDEGVEALIVESMNELSHGEMSCCESEETEETSCNNLDYSNSCELTRLSLEPTPISQVLQLNKDYSFSILLFGNLQGRSYEVFDYKSDSNYHLPPPEKALFLQGREILTAKSVLLI